MLRNQGVIGAAWLVLMWVPGWTQSSWLPEVLDASDMGTICQVMIMGDGIDGPWAVEAETRYLIVEVAQGGSAQAQAFAIKEQVVSARAHNPALKVALQCTGEWADALLAWDLAPYVDGYLLPDGTVPAADPTGRVWLRLAASQVSSVMQRVLEAASDATEVVVMADQELEPGLRQVMECIAAEGLVDLERQPTVDDLSDNVYAHVFLNPKDDSLCLYLFAPEPGDPHFLLGVDPSRRIKGRVPEGLGFQAIPSQGRLALTVHSAERHMLLEILPEEVDERAILHMAVTADAEIDPYEVVVQNQVFLEQANGGWQSAQFLEELHVYPQDSDEVPFTWVERCFMRRGKPTEHHDLDLLVHGVPYPKDKQREEYVIGPGRFTFEALQIQLDRRFEYRYLGREEVNGFACHKIAFEPANDGLLETGVVWIDCQNGAHRRLQASQVNLEPPFVSLETVAEFGWVTDGKTRYWTRLRDAGLARVAMFGGVAGYRFELQRREFRFDNPEIDQIMQDAYASEVRIIRETPQGPRYLIPTQHRKARKRPEMMHPVPETANRVIAEPGVFAGDRHLVVGGGYDANTEQGYPILSFVYFSQNLFNRGLQFAVTPGMVALSDPEFMGRPITLTGMVVAGFGASDAEVYRNGQEQEDQQIGLQPLGLGVGVGGSLFNRSMQVNLSHIMSYQQFERQDETNPAFLLPEDHLEHLSAVDITWERAFVSLNGFFLSGTRDQWKAWGLNGEEIPEDHFLRFGADVNFSAHWAVNHTFNARASLVSGQDLDRFSSFTSNGTQRVSGFGSVFQYHRGMALNLDSTVTLFSRLPLAFQLDAARLKPDPESDSEIDLVGAGLEIRMNGPFKTDVSVGLEYGIWCSDELFNDNYTVDLAFTRRL